MEWLEKARQNEDFLGSLRRICKIMKTKIFLLKMKSLVSFEMLVISINCYMNLQMNST